jgi:hypothetical protein
MRAGARAADFRDLRPSSMRSGGPCWWISTAGSRRLLQASGCGGRAGVVRALTSAAADNNFESQILPPVGSLGSGV